jgi:peptidoglycan/LPS O-acetylase OafA/YrhL
MIGASLGVIAGLLGAAVGILNGRRRNPRLTEALLTAGVGIGVIALVLGGFALLVDQPWHVAYPLLLTGLILTIVNAALLPQMRRNHAAAELHRMRALDA